MTHPEGMQPIPVESERPVALPVGEGEFTLALPVFEGPLQLLLHLIESRQLDILTVPLTEVADAYVEHLARHPVDAANLSEFVSIAAQLIFLKSKRMLPSEPLPPLPDGTDEPDEEELRRRILEYRALRDAQYYACANWTGYSIVNSTTLGSKSVAAMGAASPAEKLRSNEQAGAASRRAKNGTRAAVGILRWNHSQMAIPTPNWYQRSMKSPRCGMGASPT